MNERNIELAAQPEQEPVAYTNGIDVILAKHWTADYPPEGWNPLGYTTPPEHRNFCSRCGKRTPDLTTIHTCTPPCGLEMP